jgi:hypothetical protein
MAANAIFDASVRLVGCRCGGEISLGVTQISGSLLLDGARVTALSGISLRIGSDLLARDGFTCGGELRLDNAEIGGSVHFEGATLNGAVRLGYAAVTSGLSFERTTLSGSGSTGTALDCHHLTTRELVLLPTRPPGGIVDLSHARIGLLRDDPTTWPTALHVDGLTYETPCSRC